MFDGLCDLVRTRQFFPLTLLFLIEFRCATVRRTWHSAFDSATYERTKNACKLSRNVRCQWISRNFEEIHLDTRVDNSARLPFHRPGWENRLATRWLLASVNYRRRFRTRVILILAEMWEKKWVPFDWKATCDLARKLTAQRYLNDIEIFVIIELNLWLDGEGTISRCARCAYRWYSRRWTRIYRWIGTIAEPFEWRWTRRWRSFTTIVVETRRVRTPTVRRMNAVRLWLLTYKVNTWIFFLDKFLRSDWRDVPEDGDIACIRYFFVVVLIVLRIGEASYL